MNVPTSASRAPRVAIAGHFAPDATGADGQIVRSRAVRDGLVRELGNRAVRQVDTSARDVCRLVRMHAALWRTLMESDVLVALPGIRAVQNLLPQYIAWHKLTGRPVHLVAIGGWLPQLTATTPSVGRYLRACERVYVQTQTVLDQLHACGIDNAIHFPNFRRFESIRTPTIAGEGPVRAVFVSRVIPAKGVEVAVRAVVAANRACSGTCTLDVFGPIPAREQPWFRELESQFSNEIQYLGEIPPDEVQTRLRNYEVMLFPTTYPGEGFPGVLVEGMIAGLALLASDWMSNSEAVRHGETGFVLPTDDPSAFADKLIELSANRSLLLSLQQQSAETAKHFHADVVMPILLNRLRRT